MRRIAALLTCHNRRDLTLACIERLNAQAEVGEGLRIILLDAGSTDGTAEAVEWRFSDVTVLRGHSRQFWNRGMHAAFAYAVRHGPYDFYLWVNDDTLLDDNALAHLLETHARIRAEHPEPLIVVGATRDPDTAALTYGGVRQTDGGSRLRFERVPVVEEPTRVDTMNGNCVLISSSVVGRVGVIDPVFFHSLGDYDYGLRATAAGCSIWVAPATVGTCKLNRLPPRRWVRLNYVFGRKRMRFGEWYTFARRWGGRRWPVLVMSSYVRRTLQALAVGRDG